MPSKCSIKVPNRVTYFFIAAGIFSLALMAIHSWYSLDYFGIVLDENRYEHMVRGEMASGRYLSVVVLWLCQALGLDTVRDYPIFVLGGALAMALFLRSVYLDFLKLPDSLYWFTFFCASFLFSGAMLDLLSYREVPHHTPAMFAAAYLFLVASGIHARVLCLSISTLAVAATFAIYQPAVTMLVMLVVLRTMFSMTRGDASKQVWHDMIFQGLAFAVGTVVYFCVKWGIDAQGVRVSRPMLDLSGMNVLRLRVVEYATAIGSLFATPSDKYKWAHIGIGLILALASYLRIAFRGGVARFMLSIGLILSLIILMQNPMNFFMQVYWPTPRSSYYWALVPGLLLAYAFAGAPSGQWQKIGQYVMICLAVLYASAATVLLNDGYELRKRDFALAQLIASEVRSLPELEGATKIRMPGNWWELLHPTYYKGVDGLAFDYGTPTLTTAWAIGPYLKWATGLKFEYAGTSVCSTPSSLPSIKVTKVEGMVNVCFE